MMSREVVRCSSLANGAVFFALFLAMVMFRLHPGWFDHPVAKAMNVVARARGQSILDWLAAGAAYPSVEGVAVLSLVWYFWFADIGSDLQARLVCGVISAVVAGLVAHVLQRMMPSTPKPIFDLALQIPPAASLGDLDVQWMTGSKGPSSFPSERATLFAALAIVLFLLSHKVGSLALGFFLVAEVSRVYLGLHYPSDIIGSFFLAAAVVWLGQMGLDAGLGSTIVGWYNASASTFCMCAFFASYQLATAFSDLRTLMSALLR